jgi:acyl dehydratase/NAD(P)-dependent dehydrogenase (short-subunit alcohol dehydrogenase family)
VQVVGAALHKAPTGSDIIEAAGATRIFGEADQERFARLSGDWNPIHMDVRAARRTQAGSRVVHGMHLFLWMLDRLASSGHPLGSVTSAKVQFSAFVHLERQVMLTVVRSDTDGIHLRVTVDKAPVVRATLKLGKTTESVPHPEVMADAIVPGALASELQFEDIGRQAGRIGAPDGAIILANTLFPALCHRLGTSAVCEMALLSMLVGMVVPGLHSILSNVAISFHGSGSPPPGCVFRVTRTDARFRQVELTTEGARVSAVVTAFVRFPPPPVPTLEAASAIVASDEFRGRRALIIGGSRGIGAATAKLIAAGGGTVALSYAERRTDAEAVAKDINLGRGTPSCTTFRYDATAKAEPQLEAVPLSFTHVYYFATPQIFGPRRVEYSASKFLEFVKVYVDGFYNVVMAIVNTQKPASLSLFYPSSVAVAERPRYMTEYSMAKAAGEILCVELARNIPGVSIAVPRLPRIETDQTATVPPVAALSAFEVILPLLRAERG